MFKKIFGSSRLAFENLKARLGSLGKKLGSAHQKVGSEASLLCSEKVLTSLSDEFQMYVTDGILAKCSGTGNAHPLFKALVMKVHLLQTQFLDLML